MDKFALIMLTVMCLTNGERTHVWCGNTITLSGMTIMAAEVMGPNTVNAQVSTSDMPGPQYPPHFCLAAE